MDFVYKTVVCLMWYVAGNQADSDIQNPYYAYDYQDMTVLLQSTIKTSLLKATKLCEQNNGVLAHVSRGMYEKAKLQFQVQVGKGRSYWVALNKPRESNVYTWPDGTPYNTNFYPNFPFFGPQNEQCAYVWKSSRGTYAYSAIRCNGTAEVLCLIENPSRITTKATLPSPVISNKENVQHSSKQKLLSSFVTLNTKNTNQDFSKRTQYAAVSSNKENIQYNRRGQDHYSPKHILLIVAVGSGFLFLMIGLFAIQAMKKEKVVTVQEGNSNKELFSKDLNPKAEYFSADSGSILTPKRKVRWKENL